MARCNANGSSKPFYKRRTNYMFVIIGSSGTFTHSPSWPSWPSFLPKLPQQPFNDCSSIFQTHMLFREVHPENQKSPINILEKGGNSHSPCYLTGAQITCWGRRNINKTKIVIHNAVWCVVQTWSTQYDPTPTVTLLAGGGGVLL